MRWCITPALFLRLCAFLLLPPEYISGIFPLVYIFHFIKMHTNEIFPFMSTFLIIKIHTNAYFPFVCIQATVTSYVTNARFSFVT